MGYNNDPQKELAIQYINGNRKDVYEAIHVQSESHGVMSAVILGIDVYRTLVEMTDIQNADSFRSFLNAMYELKGR